MGAEPGMVVDFDPARGPALVEHRDVGAVVQVVAADEIRVGRDQHLLPDAHARRRKNLDVEPQVGVVVDDDVAVFAAQNRVAADEGPRADLDAAVVGAFRVEAAVVVDDHVVRQADLVGVAQDDADAEGHAAAAPAEEQWIEPRPQSEAERTRHGCAKRNHDLECDQGPEPGLADDQIGIALALRLPFVE